MKNTHQRDEAVLEEIADVFKIHVNPERGITNIFVKELTAHLDIPSFRGVFAADEIPPTLLQAERPLTLIVNLAERFPSPSSHFPNTGHFVMIRVEEEHILYIDSFAMGCWQPRVNDFIEKFDIPLFCNTNRIQHEKSMLCGLYAILFAMIFERLHTGQFVPRIRFDAKKLKENDTLCISYFKKMLQ